MAPPTNELILAALLVSFAAVAQPSAAIRAEGSGKADAAAPAPGALRLPTASLLPPDFPCLSILPPVLRQLCHVLFPSPSPSLAPAPPKPAAVHECRSWLARMKPCAGFLASSNDGSPTDACCDSFDSIYDDGAAICFCHLAVGDVGSLVPAPVNMTRVFMIPGECDSDVRLETFAHCATKYVPPIDLPSPSPSDDDDHTC